VSARALAQTAAVVVVGGGISGLAAAWWLEQTGLQVVLLEAAARAGGTIGTAREQGCLVEAGPNSALETSPLVVRLIEATGIAAQRIDAAPAARKRYVLHGGRLIALPLSLPALLATPLFSLGAKLALLREPFLRRGPAGPEESVAQFVRRRLGQEFLDCAVDPFVAGVYAGDPERLSLGAAFPRLHALEQRYGSLIRGQILGRRERARATERSRQAAPMFSFRDGMQTLPEALAARLGRVRLACRAISLARDSDGGWIVSAQAPDSVAPLRARAVVLAVPAYEAVSLVRGFAPEAAEALARIVYAPVAVVASAYAREALAHPLDGFGFLVPAKERRHILGCIFSSTLFESRAPAGTALLTSFVGGMRHPELVRETDEAIAALVRSELGALLGARGAPRWVKIRSRERAIPQYTLGHTARIDALERAEAAHDGLFFCANYRGGIAVSDCIKSGHAVAGRIAALLGAPKRLSSA
jgi:oxygen-dependent protoporphyrinogen oxidase